jgi:hypothetical protein
MNKYILFLGKKEDFFRKILKNDDFWAKTVFLI